MAANYFDYGQDGLDDVSSVDPADWEEIADALAQSQEKQRVRLEHELAEIDEQLADRDRLHRDIVAELEWQIERYTHRLDHLYTIGKGKTDGTRERVKNRLRTFSQELRDEQRDHWRDRQQLEQQRRDVRRELDAAINDSLADLDLFSPY